MVSADEQAMHIQKLKADQAAKWAEQLDAFLTEGAKAAILLNSGSIVATLGFLQALAGKDLGYQFLGFGVVAALLFTVGAIAAVATFHTRHRQLWEVQIRHQPAYIWTQATYGLATLSLVCFTTGVGTVLLGANSAYKHRPSSAVASTALPAPGPSNAASK